MLNIAALVSSPLIPQTLALCAPSAHFIVLGIGMEFYAVSSPPPRLMRALGEAPGNIPLEVCEFNDDSVSAEFPRPPFAQPRRMRRAARESSRLPVEQTMMSLLLPPPRGQV